MSQNKQHKYRYLKLAEEIRAEILSGRYAVGQKLATVDEMVKQYDVARCTVTQAMDQLAAEGLIDRGRGRGTFVADRSQTGEVAVVLRMNRLGPKASPAYAMFLAMLMGGSADHRVPWRTRLYPIPPTTENGGGPEGMDLLDIRTLRELRGVFTFHYLPHVGAELAKKRIPVVMIGQGEVGDVLLEAAGTTYQVWVDLAESYRLVMAHLKEVGCRTVGAIWDMPLDRISALGSRLDQFKSAAGEAGINFEPRWLVARPPAQFPLLKTERGGWELFHQFWKLPRPRPDALFIDDEYTCRGVLRAASELNVRLGQDIKLISTVTEGLELPTNLQVTRLELSPAEIATHAISAMEQLMAGRIPTPRIRILAARLIHGETT